MIKILLNNFAKIANIVVILLLLLLPYYLFEGRLFLGGDDTRFYYAYPDKVLYSLNLFSWNNISSLPSYIPNHHSIPFLTVGTILGSIITSKVHLFYLLFSLLQILSFIYFQKFVRELIGKEYIISILGALIYVLSPITLVTMSFFLTPVWVTALFPIMSYYFLCFVKRGETWDVVKGVLWSIFLSVAYFALPWIGGMLIPVIVGFVFSYLFVGNPIKKKIKRIVIFGSAILASQIFWLIPFISSITYRSSGLGERVSSKALIHSFAPTILATATDNVIYPMLTFYHRQIAIDYDLQLKDAFLSYYDHVLPFSVIFVVVVFLALINYKKVLKGSDYKTFIFLFVTFLASLYFFTVNIGFLKQVFLLFGYLPGFAVFRNFTDKFAIGYIFIYALFLSVALYVIKKSFKQYLLIFLAVFVVVLINFAPVKLVIGSPLWTTKNIHTTVIFPSEYLDFVGRIKSTIPSTNNIIGFPQDIAAYSVITEQNGKNAYVGVSPVKFLTNVNDLSGGFSYPAPIADKIRESIENKDYKGLLKILTGINAGYMMVTNNIPEEVKKSYLFDKAYLKAQDKDLINGIRGKEIIKSKNGNYVLYKLKNSTNLISSTTEIKYKKINPIKYEIKFKNLKNNDSLQFIETYHPGWKLYPTDKSHINTILDNSLDIFNLFKGPVFDKSHREIDPYGHEWEISSRVVKDTLDKKMYKVNKDGTVNITLVLYFLPQSYFYFGVVASLISLSIGGFYLFNKKNENHKKGR